MRVKSPFLMWMMSICVAVIGLMAWRLASMDLSAESHPTLSGEGLEWKDGKVIVWDYAASGIGARWKVVWLGKNGKVSTLVELGTSRVESVETKNGQLVVTYQTTGGIAKDVFATPWSKVGPTIVTPAP